MHLLVPALGRAVALEEVQHACRARRRAPAPRGGGRARRTSPAAGCRRRSADCASRFAAATAASRSAAERTIRMPLPPPPAAALTRTGKLVSSAAAGRGRHDGTTGTPAATAISRACVLAAHLLHHLGGRADEDQSRVPRPPRRRRPARRGSRSPGGSPRHRTRGRPRRPRRCRGTTARAPPRRRRATCGASASASVKTATVRIPSRRRCASPGSRSRHGWRPGRSRTAYACLRPQPQRVW